MQRLALLAAALLLFASASARADILLVKAGDALVSVKTGLTVDGCETQAAATQAKLPTGLTASCVADNTAYTGAHLQ